MDTTIQKLFLRHYPRIHSQGGIDFNGNGRIEGGEKLDANGDGRIDEAEYWGLFRRGLSRFNKSMIVSAMPILVNKIHNNETAYVPILNAIGKPAYSYMLMKIAANWCSTDSMRKYGGVFKHAGDKAVPFLYASALPENEKQYMAAVHALSRIGSRAAANALINILLTRAGHEWPEPFFNRSLARVGDHIYQRLISLVKSRNYPLAQTACEILKIYAKRSLPSAVESKVDAAIRSFRPIKVRVGRIRPVPGGRGKDDTPSYYVKFTLSTILRGARWVVPYIGTNEQGLGKINGKRTECKLWMNEGDSEVELRFYDKQNKYLGKTAVFTITIP